MPARYAGRFGVKLPEGECALGRRRIEAAALRDIDPACLCWKEVPAVCQRAQLLAPSTLGHLE